MEQQRTNRERSRTSQRDQKSQCKHNSFAETQRKGQGVIKLEDGYTLLFSGVPIETLTKAGVALHVNEQTKM